MSQLTNWRAERSLFWAEDVFMAVAWERLRRVIRLIRIVKWLLISINARLVQWEESLEDERMWYRSIKGTTLELTQNVRKVVLGRARLKEKELVEIVEVSNTKIFEILHDPHGSSKLSARLVLRIFTPSQKQEPFPAARFRPRMIIAC